MVKFRIFGAKPMRETEDADEVIDGTENGEIVVAESDTRRDIYVVENGDDDSKAMRKFAEREK